MAKGKKPEKEEQESESSNLQGMRSSRGHELENVKVGIRPRKAEKVTGVCDTAESWRSS